MLSFNNFKKTLKPNKLILNSLKGKYEVLTKQPKFNPFAIFIDDNDPLLNLVKPSKNPKLFSFKPITILESVDHILF